MERAKVRREAKKRSREQDSDGGEHSKTKGHLEVISLSDFLNTAADLDNRYEPIDMHTVVDVGTAGKGSATSRDRADEVAKIIGDSLSLHWK